MKRIPRLDYAYAVGRVRALERHLIPQAVLKEAAGEKDFQGALKIIFDAGKFSEEWLEIRNSSDVDKYFAQESLIFLDSVKELFLDPDVFEIIKNLQNPQQMLSLALSLDLAFIIDYVRHIIGLGNLKLFARAKYRELPKEKLELLLMDGGFYERSRLLLQYDLPLTEISDFIFVTPYKKIWGKAIDTLVEQETFVDLERGIEDFLMVYLKRARYIVFGPEPVFSFTLAKLRELDLVRFLVLGKLNQIPADLLKNRMSETYV